MVTLIRISLIYKQASDRSYKHNKKQKMKTFAATFALIGFTSAIGISQDGMDGMDELNSLDDAGFFGVFNVAEYICIEGDSDAH